MPFQFSNEGVPYHPLIAPEVPQPDNTAAKIISQGTQAGVMGFVHMAVAAEQAKQEQQKMLQDADLAAQTLQYKDKWQQQDYQIKKDELKSIDQYRNDMSGVAADNADSLREYRSGLVQAKSQQQANANAFMTNYATTQTQTENRALQAATKLKLNDEQYRNDNPVQWLQGKEEFEKRFGLAKVGAIPGMINDLNVQAKKMTVPFMPGALYQQQFDPKTNAPLMNPDGSQIWKWTGATPNGRAQVSPTPLPLSDVVKMWQDPTQRESVENGLIAAGHGQIVDQITRGVGKGFLGFRRPTKQTAHQPVLDAYGNKILGAAGKVTPSTAQSEVDPILQQSRPPKWMLEAGAGQDLSGDNSGGDASQIEADHVKVLIAQHPELAPQLKGTFYATYPNFDPNYLDSP